ncbi:MAG: ATPase [Lachnospiraceae bacterium]|nr:ATPase [Lachnospiraceae bacterium]
MIEKMKFLSISGPKNDIDRVVDEYLSKYEIHLENTLSELKTVRDLRPFTEANPYRQEYQRAAELAALFPESAGFQPDPTMDAPKAASLIQELDRTLMDFNTAVREKQAELKAIEESLNEVLPFVGLNYNISQILKFRYIKYRFGRISREYYDKFSAFVYDTIDTILFPCHEDKNYVWLVYFVPQRLANKVDAIYASMHFERFYLQDEYTGTPTEACQVLRAQADSLQKEIESLQNRISSEIQSRKSDLLKAYARLSTFTSNFDIRKMAACTKHEKHTFYILCGWMAEKDAEKFRAQVTADGNIFCIVENNHTNLLNGPPTKMKNPWLFNPFEMFIQMYGLPAYNEIDPTVLIGITYSFLFGFMFGDAGQGLCLLAGGFLLYRAKKMSLAAIISCCGFFSTIFGLLFGSIFGFEEIIEPLWLRPAQAMTNLPFIGKLNTVFIVAVAMGMGIILLTMILNIINAYKAHEPVESWFDTNGIAGFVFYASLVITVILYMTGKSLPATFVLVVMFLIPLALIFLKEPLTAVVEKKAEKIEGGKGMFVVQGFFEMFEVLLSYFSNTLSFVRVGAFAVSHAAMMEVVLMLAGVESGNPNWLVVVLGNLFVCGMEGLIVGIQVLRLEYYELFSRFYRGTGRPFKPYGKTAA